MNKFLRIYTINLLTCVNVELTISGLIGILLAIGLIWKGFASGLIRKGFSFGLNRNLYELKNKLLTKAVSLLALMMAFLIMSTLSKSKVTLTKAVFNLNTYPDNVTKKQASFDFFAFWLLSMKLIGTYLHAFVLLVLNNEQVFTYFILVIALLITYFYRKLFRQLPYIFPIATVNITAIILFIMIFVIVACVIGIVYYVFAINQKTLLFLLISIFCSVFGLLGFLNVLLVVVKKYEMFSKSSFIFTCCYQIVRKIITTLNNTRLLDYIFKLSKKRNETPPPKTDFVFAFAFSSEQFTFFDFFMILGITCFMFFLILIVYQKIKKVIKLFDKNVKEKKISSDLCLLLFFVAAITLSTSVNKQHTDISFGVGLGGGVGLNLIYNANSKAIGIGFPEQPFLVQLKGPTAYEETKLASTQDFLHFFDISLLTIILILVFILIIKILYQNLNKHNFVSLQKIFCHFVAQKNNYSTLLAIILFFYSCSKCITFYSKDLLRDISMYTQKFNNYVTHVAKILVFLVFVTLQPIVINVSQYLEQKSSLIVIQKQVLILIKQIKIIFISLFLDNPLALFYLTGGLSKNPYEIKKLFKYARLGVPLTAAANLFALMMAFLIMFTSKVLKVILTKALTEDNPVEICKSFFLQILQVFISKKKRVQRSLNNSSFFLITLLEDSRSITILCVLIAIIIIFRISQILRKGNSPITFKLWGNLLFIASVIVIFVLLFFIMFLSLLLKLTSVSVGTLIFFIVKINVLVFFLLNIFNVLLRLFNTHFFLIQHSGVLYFLYKNLETFINILYKSGLLEKLFNIIWFQFFNKNQKIADASNIISVLFLICFTINTKIFIELLLFILQEDDNISNHLSEHVLFYILLFFICGMFGLYYRLIIDVSRNIISFVFLYIPKMYYSISIQNKSKNKPQIHFIYNEIACIRWAKSTQVALCIIWLGLLIFFHYFMLNFLPITTNFWEKQNELYKEYTNKTGVQSLLHDREYLLKLHKAILEKEQVYTKLLSENKKYSSNNQEFLEKLKELQQEKRKLAALYKPESSELIFKYFYDERLKFQKNFPIEDYAERVKTYSNWLNAIIESEKALKNMVPKWRDPNTFFNDYPAIKVYLEQKKKVKRFLQAVLNPEKAELIFKDFSEELEIYRKSYPIVLEEFHKKMIREAPLSMTPITIAEEIIANMFENIENETGILYLNIIIGTSFWIIYVLLIIKKWLKSNKI